jgi:hypothetical protein
VKYFHFWIKQTNRLPAHWARGSVDKLSLFIDTHNNQRISVTRRFKESSYFSVKKLAVWLTDLFG